MLIYTNSWTNYHKLIKFSMSPSRQSMKKCDWTSIRALLTSYTKAQLKGLPEDLANLLFEVRNREKEREKKKKYRKRSRKLKTKETKPVVFVTKEDKKDNNKQGYSDLSEWIANNLLN